MINLEDLLQDANQRIADLEKEGDIKHDTIMRLHKRIGEWERLAAKADNTLLEYARHIIELEKRIMELQENFRLSIEWLESIVFAKSFRRQNGEIVWTPNNDETETLAAFRRVLEKGNK